MSKSSFGNGWTFFSLIHKNYSLKKHDKFYLKSRKCLLKTRNHLYWPKRFSKNFPTPRFILGTNIMQCWQPSRNFICWKVDFFDIFMSNLIIFYMFSTKIAPKHSQFLIILVSVCVDFHNLLFSSTTSCICIDWVSVDSFSPEDWLSKTNHFQLSVTPAKQRLCRHSCP